MHYSSGDYTYKVGETKIKCLDCPVNENDHDDIDIQSENINEVQGDSVKTVTVKVNGREIIRTETKTKTYESGPGSLNLNKDGILIKTK